MSVILVDLCWARRRFLRFEVAIYNTHFMHILNTAHTLLEDAVHFHCTTLALKACLKDATLARQNWSCNYLVTVVDAEGI